MGSGQLRGVCSRTPSITFCGTENVNDASGRVKRRALCGTISREDALVRRLAQRQDLPQHHTKSPHIRGDCELEHDFVVHELVIS